LTQLLETIREIPPEDLSDPQIEEIRSQLLAPRGGLFAFCWAIFQYQDIVPEIHKPICDLMGIWGTPGYERLMVQIPREFFKTSIFTRGNALWQVCRGFYQGSDESVAIFNERLENTSKWIRAIKDVVQSNRLFHVLFRDLLPPGVHYSDKRAMPRWWKWSDVELLFQRNQAGIPEASITGSGITAAATGGHWPTIIKDDIISVEAARSSAVMEFAKEWFDKSLYLERPALKGRDLIVCTPWTYDDVYSHIIRKYNYKVYRRSALEAGKSIFPQKLTTEELLLQQERDPFGFSSQMQCHPRPGREQNFQYSWLKWGHIPIDQDRFIVRRECYNPDLTVVPGEKPPRITNLDQMAKVILFDPAPSEQRDRNKERHARNALVVEGIDCWGRRYLLECWADRVDPYDVLRQLFKLCRKWGTNRVAIEEEVFSKLYRPLIRMHSELYEKSFHIQFVRLLTKKQDKDTRITAMIPKCREGLYYINEVGCEEWVQEYVEYPHSRTRDLLDAWAYDDQALRRPLTGVEVQDMVHRQGDAPSTRDSVTGY
jgi:hypothetical protein